MKMRNRDYWPEWSRSHSDICSVGWMWTGPWGRAKDEDTGARAAEGLP